MWDQKDVDLIAQCFEQLAPAFSDANGLITTCQEQRARLLVTVAEKCNIGYFDLIKAMEWHKVKRKQQHSVGGW